MKVLKDSKGFNNKQYLIRDILKPPLSAKARAKEMVEDEEVLKVFVDASELDFQGIFGLGVCFVGQGSVKVISKKHYNQMMKTHNVYAELKSISFAIEELDKIIANTLITPSSVKIFSDCVIVDKLRDNRKLTRNSSFNEIGNKIVALCRIFEGKYETIDINLITMNSDIKRYNPFYKAAHNAARKALNKN